MDSLSGMWFINIVAASLVAILGFFLKVVYGKLDDAVSSINKLNESVAVAITNQTHNTERIKKIESESERIWSDISRVRQSIHETRNSMAKIELNSINIENIKNNLNRVGAK